MRTEWVQKRMGDPIRTQMHYARKGIITDEERRQYFAESLFLNTVRYENDRLEAYLKKLARK